MMDSMNSCCCCLLRLPEKDLKTPYIRLGVTEIFADMLEECFQIQLAVYKDNLGVCEECVGRLRDASVFKLQVQRSQEKLWAHSQLQHVKKEPECESKTSGDVVYNEEIMPIPNIKSEAATVLSESAQPGSSTEQLATYSNTDTKMYETVHQCDICLATFTQESHISLHMKKMHDKNEACDTFEKQFTMFCSSSIEENRRYICRLCAAVFYCRNLLSEHQKDCYEVPMFSSSSQQADKPGPGPSRELLSEHRQNCHEFPMFSSSSQLANKRGPGSSRELLSEHQKDCHEFTMFSLSSQQVDKRGPGPSIELLSEYQQDFAKKRRKFSCHICGMIFKKKYMYAEHVRTHTGEEPFVCGICNKDFTAHRSLTTHMSIHDENIFICDVCSKQYTTAAQRTLATYLMSARHATCNLLTKLTQESINQSTAGGASEVS